MIRENLDLLSTVAGEVTVGGVVHQVKQYDGECYRVLYALEHEGANDVRDFYALIPRLVPTLTAEDIGKLTAEQVGVIVRMPGRRVQAIEDQFPNSERPAATPAPA